MMIAARGQALVATLEAKSERFTIVIHQVERCIIPAQAEFDSAGENNKTGFLVFL